MMQARDNRTNFSMRLLVVLFAIAGAVALGLFSNRSANRTTAQSNQPEDRIAFTRDGQIFTVKPDGSQLIPFAAGYEPSWATTQAGPGKIAFAHGPSDFSRVSVINDDGTGLVEVVPADVFTRTSQPNLSADATRVALINEVLETDPGEPAPVPHSRIYVVDADGQNYRPFFNATVSSGVSHEFFPTWSMDGTRIAYIGQKADLTLDLYVVNADGQTPPVRITNFGDTRMAFSQLAWSPDGKKLAFAALQDIYVVNTDGTNGPTNLTHTTLGKEHLDPAWSPDGLRIAYSLNYADSNNLDGIYVMDADGQNQTFLNTAGSQPSWKQRMVTQEPSPSPTPDADVAVELSASPNSVAVGEELTYTMIVRNNGPATAENVEANLVRSASLQLVAASSTEGSCGSDANPLICQVGPLAAGAQTSIRFVVRPTVAGEVVTFAGARSETPDRDESNNSRQLAVTVSPSCVPEVTAQVQQLIVHPGNQSRRRLTHTILLRNNSGRALNGMTHLVFDGLAESIQSGDARNAFARTQCAPPLGRKYMTLRINNGVWRPGQIITARVEFFNPQRVRVNYRLRVYSGSGQP